MKPKRKRCHTELFKPAMKLVLSIGIVVAVSQQITGINPFSFYAPMIFRTIGDWYGRLLFPGILVGVINLVFTILASSLSTANVNRHSLAGWRALPSVCSLLSYGFNQAGLHTWRNPQNPASEIDRTTPSSHAGTNLQQRRGVQSRNIG